MKFEDVTPGLYIIDGNTDDFQEARDAFYRPDDMLKYDYRPGLPKLEFFSMGWDCDNSVDINADFEPAMVVSVAAWNELQDKVLQYGEKLKEINDDPITAILQLFVASPVGETIDIPEEFITKTNDMIFSQKREIYQGQEFFPDILPNDHRNY